MARRALGQPYRLNAVQFDLGEGDCVCFVNRTLALALASDYESYALLTERLRHKDGVIDYRNRNFFTLGDWVPNNAWLLKDLTGELAPAQSFTHVVRPKIFEERPAAPGSRYTRITFKGSDYRSANKQTRTELYIPAEQISAVLPDLRSGDVVLVLRTASGGHLGCDHLGMIAHNGNVATIVHSAPPGVMQEDLTAFLSRCNWITGLKFLRLRENARELAVQEVSRMKREKVSVQTPAAQDDINARLRARRTAAN